MIIEVGSDNSRDIFGVRDFSAKFESRLPDYNVLQTALRDPSLKSDAIDQVLEATRSVGSLQAAGLADLQWGSQMLTYMRVTASKIGDSLTIPGNGMLTSMTESLVMTMREFKVPVEMDAEAIQAVLADAAFAAGLKGLGALGPIGKIAAAIIGTARAIVQVVRNVREAKDQTREHREQLLWLSMPPLQQPDTQVDSFYVDTVLRPIMETGSWTPVVSPRFGSDLWVGLPRNGGYAFAPGEEEGLIKGSARSINGLHIRDVLDSVAASNPQLLHKFGGHAMAAGLTLQRSDLAAFSREFDLEVRRRIDSESLLGVVRSDGDLKVGELQLELAELLRAAGPWGQGFPEPLFDGLFSVQQRRVLANKHVKFVLRPLPGGSPVDAIAFNQADRDAGSEAIHAAFRMDINEYRGRRSLQLLIEHFVAVPN